jgi:hypothetical protein
MQTKVNSVAIRATNATGTGKTSTLKIGDKIIVTVTLSETVVVTNCQAGETWRFDDYSYLCKGLLLYYLKIS